MDYTGSSGEEFVAAADVNGDGKPDVLAANELTRTVTAYLNDGVGHFNTHVDTSMTNEPFQVAIGDFNGDGKLDVVTANAGDTHAATILLGNGDGTFFIGNTYAIKKVTGVGVAGVVVADFNLDGKLDFAVAGGSGLSVFLGNGDGTFGNYIESPNLYLYSLQVGDFNRDGKPDILASDGDQILLRGQGDGTFQVENDGVISNFAAGIGDFNHDGALDVVWAGSSSITAVLNTGAK